MDKEKWIEGWMPIAAACSVCGKRMDGYTGVAHQNVPSSGDVTVCVYCGAVYQFGFGLEPLHLKWAQVARLSYPLLFFLTRLEVVIQELRQEWRWPEIHHDYSGTEVAGCEEWGLGWGPGLFCAWALLEKAIPKHVTYDVWLSGRKFRVLLSPPACRLQCGMIATRAWDNWQSKMFPGHLTRETIMPEAQALLEIVSGPPVGGIIKPNRGRDA